MIRNSLIAGSITLLVGCECDKMGHKDATPAEKYASAKKQPQFYHCTKEVDKRFHKIMDECDTLSTDCIEYATMTVCDYNGPSFESFGGTSIEGSSTKSSESTGDEILDNYLNPKPGAY